MKELKMQKSKLNELMDDDQPPNKRLKLQTANGLMLDINNNKENIDPNTSHQKVRKRKIARKRPIKPKFEDLNDDVLLEMFRYLSLNDLCNMGQCDERLSRLADITVRRRFWNGRHINLAELDDDMLIRFLKRFRSVLESAIFFSRR